MNLTANKKTFGEHMIKRTFTLIELLVVIAVIGILAAMLMPALNGVKTKGKITKARAEMNAILTAIKQYEADYGVLPLTGACTDTNGKVSANNASVSSDVNYDKLMEYLTCVNIPSVGESSDSAAKNPRGTRYLDVSSSFTNTDTAKNSFRDPFGKKYTVFLDINYDGKVTINGKDLYGSVFIYSWGPNTTDNNGETGSSTNDDIPSWK